MVNIILIKRLCMFKTADLRFKYYYTQLTFSSVNWGSCVRSRLKASVSWAAESRVSVYWRANKTKMEDIQSWPRWNSKELFDQRSLSYPVALFDVGPMISFTVRIIDEVLYKGKPLVFKHLKIAGGCWNLDTSFPSFARKNLWQFQLVFRDF